MIKAIRKAALKYFSPYTIQYVVECEVVEVHHSWTRSDAMEWAACALREETVVVWCTNSMFTAKRVAVRWPVIEA